MDTYEITFREAEPGDSCMVDGRKYEIRSIHGRDEAGMGRIVIILTTSGNSFRLGQIESFQRAVAQPNASTKKVGGLLIWGFVVLIMSLLMLIVSLGSIPVAVAYSQTAIAILLVLAAAYTILVMVVINRFMSKVLKK